MKTADMYKKKKYLHACLNERQQFNPLVASVDVLLEVEAAATLKHITSRLVTKWKEPYSPNCRYVKNRVAITLVRETQCCIWGARVLASQISVTRPQWEDGAGLHLF